jgi:5'-nucleotidase
VHLVLLHTNDLHGHLEGHEPELDYSPLSTQDDTTRGGFARLAAQVTADRAAAATAGKDVILADSGDFMMGTAFSSFLGTTQATELYEMTMLGYDAITLGNHEFDFTSAATAAFIQAAAQRGVTPPLVATNIVIPSSGAPELLAIQQAGLLPAKRVVTLPGGTKVGFIGLMGAAADAVTVLATPVSFGYDDQHKTLTSLPVVQATIDDLRNNDHVDLVIALSHSGTDDTGAGEDNDLAAQTTGIDIIVSGHTHVELAQPVQVGHTFIVSTGAYGLSLGNMAFTYTPGVGVTLDSYGLEAIDDSILGDATVQGRIDGYVAGLDTLFGSLGLPAYFGVVGHTHFDLTNNVFVETPLGDLVTDAFRAAGQGDIAVEASGNIREALLMGQTGNLSFADIFNVEPLGIGPDQVPGYPLVAVYLTGKDLKSGLEAAAAAQDPASAVLGFHDNDYFLQFSGLSYTFSASAGLTAKVSSASVNGVAVDFTNDTQCYRVICTYYVASLFGLVRDRTFGQLSISPKESDCSTIYTPLTLPSAIIDRDPVATGVQELKNWQAVLGYVGAFPTDGGAAAEVPQAYATPQGRITIAP